MSRIIPLAYYKPPAFKNRIVDSSQDIKHVMMPKYDLQESKIPTFKKSEIPKNITEQPETKTVEDAIKELAKANMSTVLVALLENWNPANFSNFRKMLEEFAKFAPDSTDYYCLVDEIEENQYDESV